LLPVAFAWKPIAVALAPAGTIAVQSPARPVAVEKHCANAGEMPNAVIMPAAAKPRSVPPHSMLLASGCGGRGSNESVSCGAVARPAFNTLSVITTPLP
jgi:hypothetical protein